MSFYNEIIGRKTKKTTNDFVKKKPNTIITNEYFEFSTEQKYRLRKSLMLEYNNEKIYYSYTFHR